MLSSMGSSGGMTVVMMVMQRNNSLKCDVFPLPQHSFKTYADAATANTSRTDMKASASLLLADMLSSLQLMLRRSSPGV